MWVWKAKRHYVLNRQLIAALGNNDSKQAIALIKMGADPNTHDKAPPAPTFKLLLNQLLHRSSVSVNNSPTALMIACGGKWLPLTTHYHVSDDLSLIRTMLEHGADCDTTDTQNATALHFAVAANYLHVAQLLLEHNANINQQDTFGDTPLISAITHEHADMLRMLLKHGANVNTRGENGATPLVRVAQMRNTDMTRLLLEYGANVSVETKTGDTALHFAVSSDFAVVFGTPDIELARLLLAHGADPNYPDRDGITPLMIAQKVHRLDIVALLQKGAK